MFRFLKIAGLCAATLSIQSALLAAEQFEWNLTQSQAIGRALAENPGQRAALSLIEQAQAHAPHAGHWENPTLKLKYASDRAFNGEGERGYAVGFEQKFPLTQRLRLEKKIASIHIDLARAEVANQSRLLAQEVASTYLRLAELEAQLALRAELLELYQSFADFVASRIDTGEASTVEVNQIKIERYAIQQEQQALEGARLQQVSALRQLLGLDPEAKLAVQFDFSLPDTAPDLPQLTDAMLGAHPAYQMHAWLYQIAEQQVSVAQAERWADIALEVFYQEERSMDAPNGFGRDRMLGVGVSVPLPLINNGQAAVAESRARREQLRYQLQRAQLELKHEADLSRQQVIQLHAQAKVYDASLSQLVAQNLADMQAAYASGQIALTDLFRAQEQGFKLRSKQLSLLHDYQQAIVDWQSATSAISAQD